MVNLSNTFNKQSKKTLEFLKKGANLSLVIKTTLNEVAYRSALKLKKPGGMDKHFIIRNKYTQRSIMFNKELRKGVSIKKMFSSYGSVQPYLAEQEKGTVKSSSLFPLVQSRIAKSIKKRVQKKSYLSTISPATKINTSNKSKTVGLLHHAYKNNIPYLNIITSPYYNKGIYTFSKGIPKKNKMFTPLKKLYSTQRTKPKAIKWMEHNNSSITQNTFDVLFNKSLHRINLYVKQ